MAQKVFAPEQVVVGLSDEQVIAWCDYIDWEENSYYAEKFTGWLKTQTFAQPEQFDVNWEGVSGNADYVMLKMEMYNTDGKLVQCINIKTQYRPRFEKFS